MVGNCGAAKEKQSSALNSLTETQVLEISQKIPLTECCHRSVAWWRYIVKFNQPMELLFYLIQCKNISEHAFLLLFSFVSTTCSLILKNCSLSQNFGFL